MVKRRIIAVTMILVMLLSLTGCAADSSGPTVRETIPESTYVAEANRIAPPVSAADTFSEGNGTPENPYQIETAEQLALLVKYVNEANNDFSKAHYIQTADIVINDTSDLDNWGTQAPKCSWTPIGIQYLNDFQGYYNGAGYIISGMYIYHVDDETDDPNTDINDIGLFGSVYEGAVENVTLRDSYVYAAGIDNVGGIVGDASYSVVTNCVNGASVTAMNVPNVGGVCGSSYSKSEIKNCSNLGIVNGTGMANNNYPSVGGICGSGYNISNCRNSGFISGAGDLGGICGQVSGIIDNCDNSGRIESENSAGGIAGNGGTMILNCHNSGDVTAGTAEVGSSGIGGIVGHTLGSVTDCSNDGTVTSVEGTVAPSVGGIVGSFYGNFDEGVPSCVTSCTNNGFVQTLGGWAQCGGIVGYASTGKDNTTIEKCVNCADVSAAEGEAGGIAGRVYASNGLELAVVDCTNLGTFNSGTELTDYTGGISAYTNPWDGTIRMEKCRNEANTTGTLCAGISSTVITIGEGTFECIDCVNTGDVTTEGSYVGGLFRLVSGPAGTVQLESCRNEGDVYTADNTVFAGGLVGGLDGKDIQISNCINEGNLTVENGKSVLAGGIVGSINSIETAMVMGCSNSGALTVNSDNSIPEEVYKNNPEWYFIVVGGITAASSKAEWPVNCSNTGSLMVTGNGKCISRIGDIVAIELDD